jgi:hypothetical protein
MTYWLGQFLTSLLLNRKVSVSFILFVVFGFLLGGCFQPVAPSIPLVTPPQATLASPTSSAAPSATTKPPAPTLPAATSTQPSYSLWLPPYLPEKLRSSISLPDGFHLADSPESADVALSVENQASSSTTLWVYALVAPFPTIPDGVSANDLQAAWAGERLPLFSGAPILMDESTLEIFTQLWGEPASLAVLVMPSDQLLDYAWANQPAWAIIPFESLEPRWKVLSIDGQSPIHKGFDPSAYPLSVPFELSDDASLLAQANILPSSLPGSNYDLAHLTTVAMTGVTALVRATAYTMELRGITYPAEDVGPLLAAADITHISNEIPFSPDCPDPTPTMPDLVFCSKPGYIDLLKAVGTDIIELTGDHFMDYGADATLYTLKMYDDLGWPYYGGGANAEQAKQPVKLENHGNKIAFIGCNVGCQVKPSIPCTAIATDNHPGAAQCDYDYIANEIPSLREQGYQVIFTFQHNEYYTYRTEQILATDFGRVAAAGASIVSGSQAHQPHGFSFQDGAFIHYGLGNLFFDQFHYCEDYACDNAFIDRHVFYEGKYISTELITLHFVDFAKPRLMTPEERSQFLQLIFSYSNW